MFSVLWTVLLLASVSVHIQTVYDRSYLEQLAEEALHRVNGPQAYNFLDFTMYDTAKMQNPPVGRSWCDV